MPKQAVVTIPEEVEQELTLLKGFRDLVAEGIGYHLGAKAVQAEASDATKDQRKAVSEARKAINIEEFIENSDIEGYRSAVETLKAARKTLSEAMKPYNQRKAPLAKAWKYCVNIAFPDSLKELGVAVAPVFSLSEWIKAATAKKKKQ